MVFIFLCTIHTSALENVPQQNGKTPTTNNTLSKIELDKALGVEKKTIEAARRSNINDGTILAALEHRRLPIEESQELKSRDFHITHGGFLVFNNYL